MIKLSVQFEPDAVKHVLLLNTHRWICYSVCGLIVGLTESDPVCDRQKLTHSHHQHNLVNDEADLIRSQQLT